MEAHEEMTFTTFDEDEVMVTLDESGIPSSVYCYNDARYRTIKAIGDWRISGAFFCALDPESAWERLQPILFMDAEANV